MALALWTLGLQGCDRGDGNNDGGEDATEADSSGAEDAAEDDGAADDGETNDGETNDGPTADTPPDAFPPTGCPRPSRRIAGRVTDNSLDELSALVASRSQPDVYLAINDSGPPRLYALNGEGETLVRYRLRGGADNFDFEDITLGPGPEGDGDWVYIGDVGDNAARSGGTPRDEVQVYAMPEPIIADSLGEDDPELTNYRTFRYTYPATSYDVEAIAIDTDGTLVFISKEPGNTQRLFHALLEPGPTVLTEVMQFESTSFVTGVDIHARGLLLRGYGRVDLYDQGTTAAERLTGTATPIPPPGEIQGEAIAWQSNGHGFVTIAEGENPPVHVTYCFGAP